MMRSQIVVIAFLGLAVSGCVESQSAYVPAVDPGENEMPNQSTSETGQYIVESTSADGSRVIRYQVETMRPELRRVVGSDGQENVRLETVTSTEERVITVPHGEDIAEYLQMSDDGNTVQTESPTGGTTDVNPIPPSPAPAPE